jgi:hypothetical protein
MRFFSNTVLIMLFIPLFLLQKTSAQEPEPAGRDSLAVLWTSADPDVAKKVCLMYTHGAKKAGWFKTVHLIVWGPSAKLLAENEELQAKIKEMKKDGIRVEACVVCADSYNVSDTLREIGVDVIPMGRPLTGYLKNGWRTLTF